MIKLEQKKEVRMEHKCFVIAGNKIVDFLWSRNYYQVLAKEKRFSKKEQELICFLAIGYFANYHKQNFFHGDIKPDNLFISNQFDITSDSGSLLKLRTDVPEDQPAYQITQYTLLYASNDHVEAI